MRLIDSHIHLTDFGPDADIPGIVRDAADAGISHLVCNGTSELNWQAVLEIATDCSRVVPCLGLHPWFVTRRSEEWLSVLEGHIRSNRCGVGEIGLDRCADPFDKEGQEQAFRSQLHLAYEYDRPVTIHCVRSWGWLMDVLRSNFKLPRRMLLHAYGGPIEMVRPLADMGHYFSFSATVLNDHFIRARKALAAVPADRLLIETDAPNMIPPKRLHAQTMIGPSGNEMNHPANLVLIADGIADLLGESHSAFRDRIWHNSREFWGSLLVSHGDTRE